MRVLVAAGLVAVVCGCGGDDAASPTAAPVEQRDRTSEEIGESSGDAADPTSGKQGAVVTIGDETFEFDGFDAPGCVRMGGQVSGGSSLGDQSTWITFTIPPEDWETNEHFDDPPVVSLFNAQDGPEIRWASGLGGGQIDSYTIDGAGARGSGTFTSESMGVSENFVSETVEGSFEIFCEG
jgi:hypothetical protein